MNVQEKVLFVDRTLESAENALNNPDVIDGLGQEAETLASLLGRLVPVLSTEHAQTLPNIADRDALPLLVLGPNDLIHFRAGSDQFTSRQILSALDTVEAWGTTEYDSDQIVAFLNLQRRNFPATNVEFTPRKGALAAQYSESTIVRTSEFKAKLALSDMPSDGLVDIKYRPLVCVYPNEREEAAEPELLLHELRHVGQAEASPILTYSNQHEIDMLVLRNELEAYHVGATVLLAMFRQNTNPELAKLISAFTKDNLQVLVDEARKSNEGFDIEDPFSPSQSVIDELESRGIRLDLIIRNALDFSKHTTNMPEIGNN